MVEDPTLLNPDLSVANSLIMFATPLASKPNVISASGPIAPRAIVIMVKNFLLPSPRPLNFSKTFPTNSTIGVRAFRNCSPTGARLTFKSSIAFLNLYVVDSSTLANSRSDKIANSSVVACASLRTLDA